MQLAKAGCRVAINYHQSADHAETVASQCREAGVKTIFVPGDVAEDAACRRMVAQTLETFGALDILVNNAGTTRFIDFPDLEAVQDEDWDRILAVNLKGPFQMARAAREALADGEGGVIVNTASIAGMVGAGSSIPYCASKAAVINLTLSLARTLGPKIRVNAVAPGFIEGDWLQQGLGEPTNRCAAPRPRSRAGEGSHARRHRLGHSRHDQATTPPATFFPSTAAIPLVPVLFPD